RCETRRLPPGRRARPARRVRRQTGWDSSGRTPVLATGRGEAVLEHTAAAAVPVLTGRRALIATLGPSPRGELVAPFGLADQRGRAYRTPALSIRVDSPPVGGGRVDRGSIGAEMTGARGTAENMAALVTMHTHAGMRL